MTEMFYVVWLRFTAARPTAQPWMAAHRAWLERGFDDRVFLLAGSLVDGAGGALLATGTSLEALQSRLRDDPFVAHGIVEVEIHPIAPSRVDPRVAVAPG
jgi:uncharacterized protein YciI